MLLFVLSYVGGVLTIVSPCILPVLPFVFTRAGQPFLRSGLPMLVGMAVSFAVVASLAAVVGGWVVTANQYGRLAAMILLVMFGVTLMFPRLSVRLTALVVSLGGWMSRQAESSDTWGASLLGIATGLLWAPCAGPVLGLILTGAALNGPTVNTGLLLFAYAAGAATSLALALSVGGKVLAMMKRSLGIGEWMRRGAGALVVVAVAVIALELDTGFLTSLSLANTSALEERLADKMKPVMTENQAGPAMMSSNSAVMGENPAMMSTNSAVMGENPAMMMATKNVPDADATLLIGAEAPMIEGATEWLNSPPLTAKSLKGKVVLVDFWTYSCINCLRTIPYTRAWAEKYKNQGFVVIGVHSPEFAFERDVNNVKRAIATQKITYPVAVDNGFTIFRSFKNQYWPAHYFIDAKGRIRYHRFGEGEYDKSERVIQQLLTEAGQLNVTSGTLSINATGAEKPPDLKAVQSPETYIGIQRAQNFVSPGWFAYRAAKDYTTGDLRLNEWGLTGKWIVKEEHASLDGSKGGIVFRFHARDLHLVLGPGPTGKPIRFKVTIDGAPPGSAHGVDINTQGEGIVTNERLYQLIRQSGEINDRTFEIQFLGPGVEAYVFTFG